MIFIGVIDARDQQKGPLTCRDNHLASDVKQTFVLDTLPSLQRHFKYQLFYLVFFL